MGGRKRREGSRRGKIAGCGGRGVQQEGRSKGDSENEVGENKMVVDTEKWKGVKEEKLR